MVTGVGNATLYQENLVKGYLTIPKKPGVRPISIPHPLGWGGRTQFDSLIAAAEAISLGEGGISIVSRATGISRDTISKGCKELEIRTSGEIGTPVPEGKIRAPGGGRKKSLDKDPTPVSYTHLRAHETPEHLVCRLLLEKKKNRTSPGYSSR